MKTKLTIFLLLLVVVVSAQDKNSVKPTELSAWAHYLASDEMKGRANGSPEMEKAAHYIAERFREAGLKPAPGMDGYLQDITFEARRRGEIEERNVIGYLEGSDPELKKEFIIYSSHFDHVGIGRPINGDSIYNGANDNVAGTATIMGLAHALKRSGLKPKRSIIFIAFAAEEMGIKGSTAFMNDPVIPAKQIILDMNMEMTGHCTELGSHRYYLTGPSFSNFDELIDEYNKGLEWEREKGVKDADRLFFNSDNRAFALTGDRNNFKLNIPAFTLCTHGGEDHIHRPHDEPEFMDYNNMADLVDYLKDLTMHLAEMDRDDIKWDTKAFDDFMNNRRGR